MAFNPIRIALYSALAIFSVILIGLTSARINHTNHLPAVDPLDQGRGHFHDRIIVELLIASIFSFLWSIFAIFSLHSRSERGLGSSYIAELIGLFILWVLFLVGTAIATHQFDGVDFCWSFNTCRILTAILAFAWTSWAMLTFLMIASFFGGSKSSLRGPMAGRSVDHPETRTTNDARPVSAAV